MNSVLIKIGKGRLLNIFSEKEKQFYRFKAVIHLMTHMLRKEKLLLLTFFLITIIIIISILLNFISLYAEFNRFLHFLINQQN